MKCDFLNRRHILCQWHGRLIPIFWEDNINGPVVVTMLSKIISRQPGPGLLHAVRRFLHHPLLNSLLMFFGRDDGACSLEEAEPAPKRRLSFSDEKGLPLIHILGGEGVEFMG